MIRPWVQGLAYARVDYVADQDHQPLVMELELTEPDLFLRHHRHRRPRAPAACPERGRNLTPSCRPGRCSPFALSPAAAGGTRPRA